jgi:SAM-dependent methyltransferase
VKYNLVPQGPLEAAALALGMVPTPLADTLVAIWLARSIMAATKLGVFDALADGPLEPNEVAARCGTDPRATAKLLGALVPTGYLRWQPDETATACRPAGRFALAPTARRWLLRGARRSLHDATLHRYLDWEFTEHFEQFVRSGEPLDFHATMTPEQWQIYQRGQRDHARLAADEVARRTRVPRGATAMLDVGGAHGLFSVALCRKNPGLCATVLDLAPAVEASAPLLAEEGMGDRVVHRVGDALTDDLGEDAYDLIFVANLVHHFDEPTNRALVQRCARALRPSGRLVIHEMIRPATPTDGGGVGALADLYFAVTSRAGTWSFEELAAWQRDAGLTPSRPQRLLSVPGLGQQMATRS